jgi:hypothetical protein
VKIDDHLSIKYENEMWLRILMGTSITSILMGRKRINKFAEFLKTLQQMPEDRIEYIEDFTLWAEKIEDNKYDISIGLQPHMSILFTIGSHQIDDLVKHIHEGETCSETQHTNE